MSNAARAIPAPPTDDLLIAPTAERWHAMSPGEQDAFLDASLAALQQEEARLSEGRPHSTSKIATFQVLRDYYQRIGRKIYLATELPVHYPGEPIFTPDLMAVIDVEDTWLDDDRMAWVVTREGRGLDLALEMLHRGSPQKDLLENVLDYARMGIPEYFVYDLQNLTVRGWRLPSPNHTRYEPIKAHGGMLPSRILGLDLGIMGGHLRFWHAGSEIRETSDILERANARMDDLEIKAEEAIRRADLAAAARLDAEQRADLEAAARQDLERRLAELLARVGEG